MKDYTKDELNELRASMFQGMIDSGTNTYKSADEIPDEEVLKNFEGVDLENDDFMCNQ